MSERNVLLKNVKHPFLVGLHFSFQTADKLYFVLDYINGGEVSVSRGETPAQVERGVGGGCPPSMLGFRLKKGKIFIGGKSDGVP